jgi:YggT family protein
MDVILIPLLNIISTVINIYIWVIIIGAILTWLVTFNVVNTSNRAVYVVGDICFRLTEPALRPIRNFLPTIGGIDLSPIVLILALIFVRDVFRGIVYAGY